MPQDARARTRAVRARMAETGENYTQATTALIFAELMTLGKRAAATAPDDLAAATVAVQDALAPFWSRVVPEAARDVLVTCGEIAAAHGYGLPADVDDLTAETVLELAAQHGDQPRPGGFAPHVAYASSAAFDRDEDPETFAAVCRLLALAHPTTIATDQHYHRDDQDGDDFVWCDDCGANYQYQCTCDDDDEDEYGYE